MKVTLWTKKVFSPVLPITSSSTTSPFSYSSSTLNSHPAVPSSSFTRPFDPKCCFSMENGSIYSNISSAASNTKKKKRLFGIPHTNSSSPSLLNSFFFSSYRERNSSCPEIQKSVDQINVPKSMPIDKANSRKVDDEDKNNKKDAPTTTTIYYYPPDPKKEVQLIDSPPSTVAENKVTQSLDCPNSNTCSCALMTYQVRQSSINYSLDSLKNEVKSEKCAADQLSSPMSFTFNSNNNGGINNNNSRSSHSVETIKKFRDSIRGITKLSFLSSRSEVHSKNCASVVPEKDAVTIKNASVIRRSTLDCSNISPIVPSPSEFASLDSKSSPVVLSDASSQDKEQSFENLIQLVGNLAREVELMKQQQHLLQQQQPYSVNNGNNRASTISYRSTTSSTDTAPSSARNSRNKKKRNLSTMSLPLESTEATHSSHPSPMILATISKTSMSTPFLPLHNDNDNDDSNSNGESNTSVTKISKTSTSSVSVNSIPSRSSSTSSSTPHLRSSSGNNKLAGRRQRLIKNNIINHLRNLPPPPSVCLPYPPSLPPSAPFVSRRDIEITCDQSQEPMSTYSTSPSIPPSTRVVHSIQHDNNTSYPSIILFPSPPSSPPFEPIIINDGAKLIYASMTPSIDTIMAPPVSTSNATTKPNSSYTINRKHKKGSSLPNLSSGSQTSLPQLISPPIVSTTTPEALPLSAASKAIPRIRSRSSLSRRVQIPSSAIPTSLGQPCLSSSSPTLETFVTTSEPTIRTNFILASTDSTLTVDKPKQLEPQKIEEILSSRVPTPETPTAPPPPPPRLVPLLSPNDDRKPSNIAYSLVRRPSTSKTCSATSPTLPSPSMDLLSPTCLYPGPLQQDQQEQIISSTAMPPKRPPRPPHLSMDLKQALTLMDARLGSQISPPPVPLVPDIVNSCVGGSGTDTSNVCNVVERALKKDD